MALILDIDPQLFQATVETLSDGIVILGPQGRVLYRNKVAQKLDNFQVREGEEPKDGDFLDDALEKFQLAQAQTEAQQETTVTLEGRHRESGELRCFSFSGTKVGEGNAFCALLIQDITTEQKAEKRQREAQLSQAKAELAHMSVKGRVEEARQEAERRFEVIFETNPAPTFICGIEGGRLMNANDGFLEMTGFDWEEIGGKAVDQLGFFKDEGALMEAFRTVQRGESVPQTEVRLQHKAGDTLYAIVAAKPIEVEGKSCGVFTFADVSELKRIEGELREAHLRLSQRRERERLSLARDLHDEVIQQLIAMNYDLVQTRQEAFKTAVGPDELTAVLDRHRGNVLAVVQRIRQLISGLRPTELEEFGLHLALENYVSQLLDAPRQGELSVSFAFDEGDEELPQQLSLCLYRTAQEALRNVRSHAQAKHASISLTFEENEAVLCIQDDGQGFNVPENYNELAKKHHFGLVGSDEYVTSLGGVLQITSQPGKGTTVTARLPLTNSVEG